MLPIFQCVCTCCNQSYEGSPSYAFSSPDYYHQLSAEEKQAKGKIDNDVCRIRHETQTDYFIRVCLEIPIHEIADPFLWGVWVSISEDNLKRYLSTWEDADENDSYFGWLSNEISLYPSTLKLQALAHPRRDNKRPRLELEPSDHPLYHDWKNGLSAEQAHIMVLQKMHENE
jgi:hypothetical protein